MFFKGILWILGTAFCTNGLFAASAESGNLVLWDIEERKATFITPLKNVFQLLLHTAETMVRTRKNTLHLLKSFYCYSGFSFNM